MKTKDARMNLLCQRHIFCHFAFLCSTVDFFVSGNRDVIEAQTFSLISRGVFFHKFALILVSSVQSQSCAGSYRCFLSKIQCGLPVTACKHCLFAFIKASLNCFFTLMMASLISGHETANCDKWPIELKLNS